jgi:hypothetical protein
VYLLLDEIDQLLPVPTVCENFLLALRAMKTMRSTNSKKTFALAGILGSYYFVNTIFELLTISIDYHQTDFADYGNFSFYLKMSLTIFFDNMNEKTFYTDDSGKETNNKKDGRNNR